VAAALLDTLLVVPWTLAGGVVAGAATGRGDGRHPGLVALVSVLCLVGLGSWVWSCVLRQGRTGWSLGKKVLGIRLVSATTGQPAGPWTTMLRQAAHLLDALPCYLGYLWPAWDARRRTFADMIVGTVVLTQPATPRPR
jgi:uncharacterized RDD family membrane protein YckC